MVVDLLSPTAADIDFQMKSTTINKIRGQGAGVDTIISFDYVMLRFFEK